jgi:hypothetical protein
MTKIDDQEYLLTRQYNNASRLNARINLHARFSVNPINWFHWLFDHYHFPPKAHILELETNGEKTAIESMRIGRSCYQTFQ